MDSWQAEKQAATRGVEVVALDRCTISFLWTHPVSRDRTQLIS
jgi:hypothetical protein